MKSKDKQRVSETALNKALDDLEGSLQKGAIPEEMKNANGGLATEGKDLSDEISASETRKSKPKMPSGLSKAKKKAMEMSDDDGSDEGSSEEEGSEDSSSEDMSKADSESGSIEKKYSASDESSAASSESMSKADSESASVKKSTKKTKKITKSLKERAEENDKLQKMMDVSPFLENMVDMISDSNGELQKSLEELTGGLQEQTQFNGKLQKAIIAIGKETQANSELIKSLIERLELAPDPSRARKSLLSKSEVRERFDGDGEQKADLNDRAFRQKVATKLMSKAIAGEIPATLVTVFEQGGAMPPDLIKSVTDEIIKSESTER